MCEIDCWDSVVACEVDRLWKVTIIICWSLIDAVCKLLRFLEIFVQKKPTLYMITSLQWIPRHSMLRSMVQSLTASVKHSLDKCDCSNVVAYFTQNNNHNNLWLEGGKERDYKIKYNPNLMMKFLWYAQNCIFNTAVVNVVY